MNDRALEVPTSTPETPVAEVHAESNQADDHKLGLHHFAMTAFEFVEPDFEDYFPRRDAQRDRAFDEREMAEGFRAPAPEWVSNGCQSTKMAVPV